MARKSGVFHAYTKETHKGYMKLLKQKLKLIEELYKSHDHDESYSCFICECSWVHGKNCDWANLREILEKVHKSLTEKLKVAKTELPNLPTDEEWYSRLGKED